MIKIIGVKLIQHDYRPVSRMHMQTHAHTHGHMCKHMHPHVGKCLHAPAHTWGPPKWAPNRDYWPPEQALKAKNPWFPAATSINRLQNRLIIGVSPLFSLICMLRSLKPKLQIGLKPLHMSPLGKGEGRVGVGRSLTLLSQHPHPASSPKSCFKYDIYIIINSQARYNDINIIFKARLRRRCNRGIPIQLRWMRDPPCIQS